MTQPTKKTKASSLPAAPSAAAGTHPGEVGAGTQPAAGSVPAAGSAQPISQPTPTPESGTPATAGSAGHASSSISTGVNVRDEEACSGGSSGGQDSQAPTDLARAEEPAEQAQSEPPPSDLGGESDITQDLWVHPAARFVPTRVLFAACSPRPDISHVLSAREYSDRWVLVVMSETRAFKVEVPHA